MSVTVFIDGAAGTTGLEIGERLTGRDAITLATLPDDRRKDPEARRQALNDADVVILCLPDDAAREAVALIDNPRTRVIDASTAHRVADGWIYGMAELEPAQTAAIANAQRVSNPGCYPTGFLALVRPLVRAGLIPAGWSLTVNAVSGYSGGGKAMIAEFEGDGPKTAWRGYALDLGHKHAPEMQRHARLEHPPIFAPSVANVYRGMVVEVPIPLNALPRKPSLGAVATVIEEAFRDSPLIRVIEDDAAFAMIEDDAGTDRLSIRVRGDAAAGQARLIATLDNLGKGAAGAAVQNLNLMVGLEQTEGLNL